MTDSYLETIQQQIDVPKMEWGQQISSQNTTMIKARAAAMLIHFPLKEETAEARKLVGADWAFQLADIKFDFVNIAVNEWIRDNRYRPSIAEIRKLALAARERHDTQSKTYLPSSVSMNMPEDMRRWRAMETEMYKPTMVDLENIRIEIQNEKNSQGSVHYPREEMRAWWKSFSENPPVQGEPLDDYKDRIRIRAKEICPSCTWQMPGEQYSIYA